MDIIDTITNWMNDATGVDFSIHGWIAFVLGAVGVLILNVGLMWLVIRSNRRGHDTLADEVGRATRHQKDGGE